MTRDNYRSYIEDIWIPSNQMIVGTTTPAIAGVVEAATSVIATHGFEFADGAPEPILYFQLALKRRWNAGTITFKPYWSVKTAVAGPVVWEFTALFVGTGERWDTGVVGTPVTSTSTSTSTVSKLFIGAETAPLTVGSVAIGPIALVPGEMGLFRVVRRTQAAGDTLAATAVLNGVMIVVTNDHQMDGI